jgi:hypothetical protein
MIKRNCNFLSFLITRFPGDIFVSFERITETISESSKNDKSNRGEHSGVTDKKSWPPVITNTELGLAFWDAFDRLENQKQQEPDGTVSESMLRQELIATGKFNAGEATEAIEDLIDHGVLT